MLDSNVFISATLFKRGAAFELVEALGHGAFELLVPFGQREELEDVLRRPVLIERYGLAEHDVSELLSMLKDLGQDVEESEAQRIDVRDPDDIPILAAALDGNADYLVTGDKDLLVLADEPAIRPLRIVTIRHMLDVLATRE